MMMIEDCIVLCGPELDPWFCKKIEIERDKIAKIDKVRPCSRIDDGAIVVMPGLWNAHTHMGDACAPDGAVGLTLEQGFFRPDGYKYRMLAEKSDEQLLDSFRDTLGYMARTGTVGHIDFREQGPRGSRLLRTVSNEIGLQSVILGQFNDLPFDDSALCANRASLPPAYVEELRLLLQESDGFSESTMNDLTDPAWREVKKITDAAGKFRAIHCLENENYRKTSVKLTGRGDLVRAIELYHPHLIIHVTAANDQEIQLLASHNVTCVLNPRANAALGLPIPPVAKLLDAGVNLLLGTDNGLLNSPNMFAELDYTYKIAKCQYGDSVKLNPAKILKMATSNMRHVFGCQFKGFVNEGGQADMIVVDFTKPHLRRSQNIVASVVGRVTPDDIVSTYRNGQLLYQNCHGTKLNIANPARTSSLQHAI